MSERDDYQQPKAGQAKPAEVSPEDAKKGYAIIIVLAVVVV